MNPIIFFLNIPLTLTVTGTPRMFVVVQSFKNKFGRIDVEFLNLTTHVVTSVTDWQAVFKMANDRAKIQWSITESEEQPDDLFAQLGSALNPNHQIM